MMPPSTGNKRCDGLKHEYVGACGIPADDIDGIPGGKRERQPGGCVFSKEQVSKCSVPGCWLEPERKKPLLSIHKPGWRGLPQVRRPVEHNTVSGEAGNSLHPACRCRDVGSVACCIGLREERIIGIRRRDASCGCGLRSRRRNREIAALACGNSTSRGVGAGIDLRGGWGRD